MSNMNPVLPTDSAPQPKLPTDEEKLTYVTANLDAVYTISVASGLIHDGGRQIAPDGETLFMFNVGGWMSTAGATRAGLFDHLIPDDLGSSPVLPAVLVEKLPSAAAAAAGLTIDTSKAN